MLDVRLRIPSRRPPPTSVKPAAVAVADVDASNELLFVCGHMTIGISAVNGDRRTRFVKDMAGGLFGGNETGGIVRPGDVNIVDVGASRSAITGKTGVTDVWNERAGAIRGF